jgi:acetyl-CoA C-acetyltransferase
VAYTRDGAAERAVLVVDVPGGGRAYAVTEEPALLADAVGRELVGQAVRLTSDGKVNVASW